MKRLMCLLVISMIFLHHGVNVHAESLFQVKRKDQVTQDWEIHLEYPLFDQMEDKKLQQKVNDKIVEKLDRQMQMVHNEANEVYGFPILYYEETNVIKDSTMFSVIMTSHISKGDQYRSSVTSVNFSPEEGEVKSLEDVVFIDRLNDQVKKAMAQDKEMYKLQKFSGVRENTAFYIKNKKIVLIFNKYEVAAGVYGTPEVVVSLDSVKKEQADNTHAPFPSIT